MYFSVKNKRKRKDRERKVEFVRCECSLCKGVFCLVKKVRRYKVVFGNKDFDYEFSLRFDDFEFFGYLLDFFFSLFVGYRFLIIEVYLIYENEDDNSLVGSEI